MYAHPRKVTPKVRAGKVQKKNNHETTFNYWDHDLGYPVIDREKPGEGCRHVLAKRDIQKFISILPDWREISIGLKAIILAESEDCYGWHSDGVIGICAWDRELWQDYLQDFYDDHAAILDRLGVEAEPLSSKIVRCKFTENQVRAFQLTHIFLHELGHHHDRMTSRKKKSAGRGEPYAEAYALKYMDLIFGQYVRSFALY